MGVCCSKNDVAKIKEISGPKSKKDGLLITENVGSFRGNQNLSPSSTTGNGGHETNPHVPLIQEPQGVQTQEAETINSFNKQDDSAARATLIFPSYSGYRNQDPFGAVKKNSTKDFAPTALVSPVQNTRFNPSNSSGKVDLLSSRYSPLPSRYSPMLTPNRDRRSPARVFRHLDRSGSLESGGFDSDLESENGDSETQTEINTSELHNRTGASQASPVTDSQILERIKSAKPTDVEPEDLLKEAAGIATEKNEIGVGTESYTQDDRKKQEIQTNTEAQPTSKASASAGADLDTNGKTFASTGVGTETASKLEPAAQKKTTAAAEIQTDAKKLVKAVGHETDGDDFYTSKKTTKVQANHKKQTATSTTSTETNLDETNKKSTHDMMVGTDPISTAAVLPLARNDTKTSTKSYVKLVDVGVGTGSDKFYRSKKSRKVQVKSKKKATVTLSTGVGTNTDLSPKPNLKLSPRIVAETNTPPTKGSVVPGSPSLTSKINPPEKQEPHPIIETLEKAFERFAKYGDINGDGKKMNNKNWAKLCRDCEFIDNKKIQPGDVDNIFSKWKPKGFRLIDFDVFLNCLNEIAEKKLSHKIEDEWARKEFIYQQVIGKAPELIGITGTSKTGNVDRMTDHHLYPVSHKMRFDEEGKGLGIEEKFEVHDTQLGYVQGYKDRDTYDFKMLGVTREKSGLNLTSSKLSPQLLRRPISSGSNRS